MKKVVSVSLGSSKRDHAVEMNLFGERIKVRRMGTDGSMQKAIRIIGELDGEVDAIGLGGIDLYLITAGKKFVVRDALKMARAAFITPVVDGSGLKNTLERQTIEYLVKEGLLSLPGRRVMLVSAVDRFGMAEAVEEMGAECLFGDVIFALGLPVPIRSLRVLKLVAFTFLPLVCRLPFKLIYPTGEKQDSENPRYSKYFDWAEVIAGDFHFIKRYMPARLDGKVIITNTVTAADVELFRQRGAKMLVTTTPELNGRSFGTNVMEAALVAVSDKPVAQITPEEYWEVLKKLGWRPRIVRFDVPERELVAVADEKSNRAIQQRENKRDY
ncbi:MAG: quinate 5-dehydrogenase [bacterium]|nr:quinate 5-dehydrogenase [bacterium]